MALRERSYSIPSQSWWDKSDYPEVLPNQFFASIVDEKSVCRPVSGKASHSTNTVNRHTGVSEVSYTDKGLRIILSLGPFDYRKVRVFANVENLLIYAEHEEVEDENYPDHTISRKLTRKYVLPKHCFVEDVRASAFEGKLIIVAPRILAQKYREVLLNQFGDEKETVQEKYKSLLHTVIRKLQSDSPSGAFYHLSDCTPGYSEVKDMTELTVYDSIIKDSLNLTTDKREREELSEKKSPVDKDKLEAPAVQLEAVRDFNGLSSSDLKGSTDKSPASRSKESPVEGIKFISKLLNGEIKDSFKFRKTSDESSSLSESDSNSNHSPLTPPSAVSDISKEHAGASPIYENRAGAATEKSPKAEETATVTSSKAEEQPETATVTSSKAEEQPETATVTSSKAEEQPETATVTSSKAEEQPETATVTSSKAEEQPETATVTSSKAEEQPETVAGTPPKAEEQPETVAGTPPKAEEQPETVAGTPPKAEEQPETVAGTPPKAEEQPETVAGTPPKAEEQPETVAGTPPKAEEQPETVAGTPPKAEEQPETVAGTPPKAEEQPETVAGTPPKAEEQPETVAGTPPKAEEQPEKAIVGSAEKQPKKDPEVKKT